MSESKSESKSGNLNDSKDSKSSSSVVDLVQEFCLSSEIESAFENFAEEFGDVFAKSIDFKEGDEHPLEFYNIYDEYLKRFERKIEAFITSVRY